jgi:hypothetical protein
MGWRELGRQPNNQRQGRLLLHGAQAAVPAGSGQNLARVGVGGRFVVVTCRCPRRCYSICRDLSTVARYGCRGDRFKVRGASGQWCIPRRGGVLTGRGRRSPAPALALRRKNTTMMAQRHAWVRGVAWVHEEIGVGA